MLKCNPVLLSALAALALAGCGRTDSQAPAPVESLVPLPSEQPAPPLPATDECGAGKLGAYRNQLPTTDAIDAIRAAIGHDRIRTIKPGDAVTMDMRPDRLNIEIGEDGRIKTLRCG